MVAYYNENDPFATQWLRELIATGLICPGEVDERSIEDVRPGDLAGYTQCHFFAGIGVWSLALRQAGWPDDRPIWTGSCPCQPFSAAGKAGGFADERHLWPAFYHLIGECRPSIVVGEQVASKDGLAWLDLVSADMEGAGYAFGAVDTCAAGFGAPHIRQRLYFGAKRLGEPDGAGRFSRRQGSEAARHGRSAIAGSDPVRMADAGRGLLQHQQHLGSDAGATRSVESEARQLERSRTGDRDGFATGGLADARSKGFQEQRGDRGLSQGSLGSLSRQSAERGGASTCERPGPTNGRWRDVDWLFCRDGKWRPVEPATFPLADAGTFRNRVAELRGAGNAINLAQATAFIIATREAMNENC